MIRNTTINTDKRKNEILSQSHKLLTAQSTPSRYELLTITHDDKIIIDIDMHEMNNSISNIGVVKGGIYQDAHTVAGDMVFDPFGMDTAKMELLYNRRVRAIGSVGSGTIRLKFAMPISVRGNNKYDIKSIKWQISHTASVSFPNGYYFIGVISNRVRNFTLTAFEGLQDAYGISGHTTYGVFKGRGTYETDQDYKHQYSNKSRIDVEYNVDGSRLVFFQNNTIL